MKIKSLLAAVSMVAITAGSANALSIPASSVVPTGIVPALELELPGTPALSGPFTFDVVTNTGSTYPGGNNLLVDVTLPAGVIFATAVDGGDITGAVNSATVQSGGAVGSSTVQFLVAVPQPATDTLTFMFDLGLNACPTAGSPLTVNIQTENNTPIENGTATTSNLIAPCASGLDGVVASDEGDSDTQITLSSGYTTLAEFFGAGPLNPTGVLGSINYTVDPTVSTSLTAVTPIAASDIASIDFDVVFEDASAVTSVFANGIPSTKSGNTFSFSATSPADIAKLIDGAADSIIAFVNGTTVIETQSVAVANSSVTFRATGAPDMIVSEAGPTGSLDALQREGRSFGYFDWNAGPAVTNPTLSVYRVTGLDPNMPVDYTLTLENSNNDGTYAGTITANSYGEAQLVSTTMPVPAGTERFDVRINIETPNTDVDIDRLMLRNGVVSDFGDGANNSYNRIFSNIPNWDSDQFLNSE